MKGLLIQFGCAFLLSLITAMNGFISAWPSYTIKILEGEHSPLGFKVSQNEANLISSIPMLGSLITTLLSVYVFDYIGRKRTQIMCGLFYAVSWSLIISARSTAQMLIARFIMGLSLGICCVSVVIFISEITHITIRGRTSTIPGLLYNGGIMGSYLLGWLCSFNIVCYVGLTHSVVYVLLMCFLKETPHYLLKIGNEKEALKSLKFYRGESETTQAILEELTYLKTQGNYRNKDEPAALPETEKLKTEIVQTNTEKNGWVLLFTVPHNRRAITSLVIFMFLVHSMGIVAVQTYASNFFMEAVPSLSPDLCSVMFSLILVLSNITSLLVMDLLPRRTLMISTCLATTICLVALGVMMRMPGVPSWLTLGTVVVYVLVFHLGVISIAFAQLAECYAPKERSIAAMLVFCSIFLASFIVLYLFKPTVQYIGIDGTFFVFAAISAFTTVLAYLWIKETRRMPLEQIQKMYDNGFLYRKLTNDS